MADTRYGIGAVGEQEVIGAFRTIGMRALAADTDQGVARAVHQLVQENVRVIKAKESPMGLQLADTVACKPRSCRNKCIFCFIDQMPPGMRPSLYVKDDDWRLSMMMGNYVTLTNVDEQ